MTEQQNNNEWKKIEQSCTLWNAKLDQAELNFLKWQENLVLKVSKDADKKMMFDIREANKLQMQKDVKLNELLNGYIIPENFEKMLKIIQPKAIGPISEWRLTSGVFNKFKKYYEKHQSDTTWFWPKMFVIRVLLDAYHGNFKPWYEKKIPPIFGSEFIRMLHNFQKETQAGIQGRSAVDCIVWRRTIQQLASYTGVGTLAGNVEIGKEFTISTEIEKKENYTLDEASVLINKIEKNKNITPTQKVNDILNIYNSLTDTQKKTSKTRTHKIEFLGKVYESTKPFYFKDWVKDKVRNFVDNYEIDMTLLNSNLLQQLFSMDVEKNKEKQEVNQKKIDMVLQFANAWIRYCQEKGTKKDLMEQMISSYNIWIKEMEALRLYTGDDRDGKFSDAFDKMFQSNQVVSFRDGVRDGFGVAAADGSVSTYGRASNKRNKNMSEQTSFFNNVKEMFLDSENDWSKSETILRIRNEFHTWFRKIDKDFDSLVWFMEWYQSWDAIIEEMESYAWTHDSVLRLRMSNSNSLYKKYNEDMNNVEVFFKDLYSDYPSKDNIAFLEEILFVLTQEYNKYDTSREDYMKKGPPTMQDAQIELDLEKRKKWSLANIVWNKFGINISHEVMIKIYEDFNKIKERMKAVKQDLIVSTKHELTRQKAELKSDIEFYKKMINNHPNSPQRENWEQLINSLSNTEQNINPDTVNEDFVYSYDENQNPITIQSITKSMMMSYCAWVLENVVFFSILENNKEAVSSLKKKTDKDYDEYMITLFSDIKWIGSNMSDKRFNKILDITKEIVVQIVICTISMWVGNLLAKWVIAWTKRALNTVKLTNAADQLWRFGKLWLWSIVWNFNTINRAVNIWTMTQTAANIAKVRTALSWWWRMVTAGSWFHLSSTMLNNLYNGQDISTGIDPFGYIEYQDENWNTVKEHNWKWYLQSIAFFGVLEVVSPGVQNLLKLNKWKQKNIDEIISRATKQKVSKKEFIINFAKSAKDFWLSTTAELASLMATETILSVTFGDGLPDFDAVSIGHMVGMIVWLRAIRGVNLWLESKMDRYIIKEVRGKNGKPITDVWSIEWITIEVTRNGKSYETVLNSKWEVVRTTDPLLQSWAEVKINEYWSRSKIPNRAPANRNNTADYIAKNRQNNEGIPKEVEIRGWEKVQIDPNGKYKDIIDQYKKLINEKLPWYEKQLEILDIQLAERITLDKWKSIEYKSEAEAKYSFEQLSKMKEYDGMLRTYKNFEWKWCVEKINPNTIMPNIYITVQWMEWRRWVDYTWAKMRKFEIPIKNLKIWDQIFTERWGKRYEFAKKENGNREVISEWGRFEKWNEVKLNKNKDWTMTFERIWDARKMEVSEIWLKKFGSNSAEVVNDIINLKKIEEFVENFDAKIMSEEWITIDGKNYRLKYEPNMTQNPNKKWEWKWIVDGETKISVKADTKVLPESSDGIRIREKYYEVRRQYVENEIVKSGKKEIEIKDQREKEQREKEQLVENAETFSDLNKVIEKIGEIDWVKGKKLDAEQVQDLINQARNWYISGKMVSVEFLPTQYGIRNKVEVLIKKQQEFSLKIDKCKSFDELYDVLAKQKIIEWSQKVYDANEIIKIVELVRNWQKTSDFITRSFGLRSKVNWLINAEMISQPIKRLWPEWLMKDVSQWGVWNCYFVACLYNLKIHPNWAKLISDMIKIRQVETMTRWWKTIKEDVYDVSFYKKNWAKIEVTITQADIQQWKQYSAALSGGQLGDYVLERAYNRFINGEKGWKAWHTMIRGSNNEFLFEGWWMHETFWHFFGPDLIKSNNKFSLGSAYTIEKIIGQSPNSNNIYTLGSLFKKSLTIEQARKLFPDKNDAQIKEILNSEWRQDVYSYKVKDIYWNYQEVYFGHAYSIWEIWSGWAEIINPHNTGKSRFKISLSEINDVFSAVTKTEFHHNVFVTP